MTTCPSCGHKWNNGDQYTLNDGLAGERVLDMTSGLLGMQREVRTLASINLDASAYRKVTVRGDFTSLPFPVEDHNHSVRHEIDFHYHVGMGNSGNYKSL